MKTPLFHTFKLVAILIVFTLSASPAAHAKTDTRGNKSNYVIRYTRTGNVAVRDSAAFSANEITRLNRFEKILVTDNEVDEWLPILYPHKGYINRYRLYTERDLDILHRNELARLKELDLIASGKTPFQDYLENKNGLALFDPSRVWRSDDRYQVKIVSASVLNLRFVPSAEFDTIGQFVQWDKIIIEKDFGLESHWDKVIWPMKGFVNSQYLFTDEQVKQLYNEQLMHIWSIEDAVSLSSITLAMNKKELVVCQKHPENNTIIKSKKADFIIRKSIQSVADTSVLIWWSDPQDPEQNNYLNSATLNLQINNAEIQDNFKARLYCRRSDEEDYRPLVLGKPEIIKEGYPTSWIIGRNEHNLIKGAYDFKVEIFDAVTGDLLTTQTAFSRKALSNINFENNYARRMKLDAFIAVSPLYLPVEADFSRFGFPWGYNFEFSKEGWRLGLGAGHNTMKAQSSTGAFNLVTSNTYIYAKYVPFRLFNDHLDLFVLAGGTQWITKIVNVKHPEHWEYYPLEADQGYYFTGGCGAMFVVKHLLVGIQYQFYGTPLVVLGTPLNEPETKEELSHYIPTNQYKLYAGSNQLQVLLGYRF